MWQQQFAFKEMLTNNRRKEQKVFVSYQQNKSVYEVHSHWSFLLIKFVKILKYSYDIL